MKIPQAPSRVVVGTFPDGSQILVETWGNDDGTETVTAAQRRDHWETWGPPVELGQTPD